VALDQSALLEVLDALKAADVDDRIRQAAQTIYQALIEAELTAVIGAVPHERSPARQAQRNGHRPRVLTTAAGDLEVRSPSSGRARSSPACWSAAGGSTRPCSRSSWRPTSTA
jgi:transposase-like protein